MQKALLLLGGGAVLGLTYSPRKTLQVQKEIVKEWKRINRRALNDAVRHLYESKLVDYKENQNGSIALVLSEKGKKKYLEYNLESMNITKPTKWDGLWRVVMFDIPEKNKKGRDALAGKLKQLGLKSVQKSVFLYPYPCKKEIDFVVEIFGLRKFVRYATLREIDIDPHLQKLFGLK